MKNIASKKFYKWTYILLGPFIRLVRPIKVIGRENMIHGAALVCANHSAMIDPILLALAFDANTNVHVMAKAELYKVPVVSWLMRKLGTIPVDRKTLDVASIKTSLRYLKNGEKVVIFPEGTRLSEHDAQSAKSGAVKLAEHADVPILPVFIPRKKPIFKRSRIIFGKPYNITKSDTKRTQEEYVLLAMELMNKIQELGEI